MIAKRIAVTVVAFGLLASLAFPATKHFAAFAKSAIYLTPHIGIYNGVVPVGVQGEYGMTDMVSVGGTVRLWQTSPTAISIEADGAYHFRPRALQGDYYDLYVGAGLGLFSVSSSDKDSGFYGGGSAVFASPFIGGRYFFNPKVAANARLNFVIVSGGSSLGIDLGVTIKLK